jgi:hypothetical protein
MQHDIKRRGKKRNTVSSEFEPIFHPSLCTSFLHKLSLDGYFHSLGHSLDTHRYGLHTSRQSFQPTPNNNHHHITLQYTVHCDRYTKQYLVKIPSLLCVPATVWAINIIRVVTLFQIVTASQEHLTVAFNQEIEKTNQLPAAAVGFVHRRPPFAEPVSRSCSPEVPRTQCLGGRAWCMFRFDKAEEGV